ncbi:hypothetical protein MUK42_35826 [Musa troglodytarum]|uniref:Uncharacterized protein n=1 Tax=Musa troglodytarum TaxID=320322 RepID=A0A9E7EHZ1_9LILI|nr:hypothetical protein MUK42_35826 [Musa troglodytarum]
MLRGKLGVVSFRCGFEIKNPHNYISPPFTLFFILLLLLSSIRRESASLPCATNSSPRPIDRFTHLAFPSSFLIRAIGSFFPLPSLSPSLPLQGSVPDRLILIDQLIDVAGSCFLFLSAFPISRFFCLSVSSVSDSSIVTETEIKIEVFMTGLLLAGLYMIE